MSFKGLVSDPNPENTAAKLTVYVKTALPLVSALTSVPFMGKYAQQTLSAFTAKIAQQLTIAKTDADHVKCTIFSVFDHLVARLLHGESPN